MDEPQHPDISTWSSAKKLEFLEGASSDPISFATDLALLARDADAAVRERALECLWDVGDPEHIDFLMEIARSEDASEVRAASVSALARFIYDGFVLEEVDEDDYEAVKETLLELFEEESQPLPVRRAALEALGFVTDDDVESLVREAYESGSETLKISALFAMGRSGTRTWDNIILREMGNPDSSLRFEAVRAAGETFMSRAAEPLERLTQDPDRDIQLAAISALGKAGRPQSRQLLRSLLSARDEDIRDTAAHSLGELDMFESEAYADET